MSHVFKMIGETEILVNTIPLKAPNEPVQWVGDRHNFSILCTKANDSSFTASISVQIISLIEYSNAISLMASIPNSSGKKIEDLYPKLMTEATYQVDMAENENYQLAYEIILDAINTFNRIFQEISFQFSDSRLYPLPSFEECEAKIKEAYLTVS